jgi:hypothetical protein
VTDSEEVPERRNPRRGRRDESDALRRQVLERAEVPAALTAADKALRISRPWWRPWPTSQEQTTLRQGRQAWRLLARHDEYTRRVQAGLRQQQVVGDEVPQQDEVSQQSGPHLFGPDTQREGEGTRHGRGSGPLQRHAAAAGISGSVIATGSGRAAARVEQQPLEPDRGA